MKTGIEIADEFGAVIDDYTAKLAAQAIATDANLATKTFARTGAVNLQALLAEVRAAAAHEDATDSTCMLCRALRTYATVVGDRQAVPGWNELKDNGPPAPPGYMGSYACIQDFVRDIGFRVVILTDGRVHVFQNPENW